MTYQTETQLLIKAINFAAKKHRNQRRKDIETSPYVNHPIALADVLANESEVTDIETLAAAILHGTVEDTETTPDELAAEFGDNISTIVMEVTDDKSRSKAERKQLQIDHASQLSNKARAVKLADKICNLRDVAQSPPEGWSINRRQEYFDWAAQVIDGLRGQWPTLEVLFDKAMSARPQGQEDR